MGCALSTLFACLWCGSGCNSQRVGAQFAFFPPQPPTYSVTTAADGKCTLRLSLQQRQPGSVDRSNVTSDVKVVPTSLGQRIPVFSFKVKDPSCTILFSHGNAMDCGLIYYSWVELAHRLNSNIFAYDYTGYGASTGTPSEKDTYADILAVYEYIQSQGIDPATEVVLYGQSVGTGPSCYLAAHRPVRGLVLHSPMVTGIRVISNSNSPCAPATIFRTCDLFPNIRRIPTIKSKVYIMHGMCDEVIDVEHSKQLLEKWPKDRQHPPYFVEGAGHDDVFEVNPVEFYRRLLDFIKVTGFDR